MIKIFIFGYSGKMGQAVLECANKTDHFKVVGGFDLVENKANNVFNSVDKISVSYDAIIDFSNPKSLNTIVQLASRKPCPIVLATTGYTAEQQKQIDILSKRMPIFLSGNMSWGVFVMQRLVTEAVNKMWDCADIEIIEKHHNQKLDAPSGTALMLANTVNEAAKESPNFLYGRQGLDAKRNKNDVTIHAVRGGSVVGEHEVSFYSDDEIISIKHTALSRKIFASGALKATKFLTAKKSGLFSMKNM